MSEFTPTGLIVDRFSDVLAKIIADQKAAYGENWKVDQVGSVSGLHANIFADYFATQNEKIEGVASAFSVAKSQGVSLSDLVLLNGIERNESAFSTAAVNVTATAAAGCTIVAGSLIEDPTTNTQWATDLEVVLTAGQTKSVSVTAVVEGPTAAAADTLTKIISTVLGWESVTNPSAAVPGLDEETDPELRNRQKIVARRTGQAGVDAIYSNIADLDETDDQYVHENKSGTIDSKGVPGTTIWAIVSGGSDVDVARAIYDTTGGGIGWFGSVTVPTVSLASGVSYDVKFSRPADIDIYVTIDLRKSASFPGDGETTITENVLKYFSNPTPTEEEIEAGDTNIQKISVDVVHSRLYGPINKVPGHSVVDLYIGTSSDPSGVDDIPIDIFQRAVTTEAKIIIRTV